ncbi:hypothetical protein QQS21_003052 [Conoideocrella luteorostrata]|uniref:Heterokaryon incompatibility domain-containing protein n=1 Tax=Conoideocrella luteorostrata TaxID=1105319 RepID=A0AAJ0CY00_9HYPO|nr:hypothetical protein QQS21_003052 [Conoideocrella luteorostrata]
MVVEEFTYDHIPEYAILSHRWGRYELTLKDVQDRIWEKEWFCEYEHLLGSLNKVQQCCLRAQADTYEYVWIDTCCIDKTSSAELSEAINSMFLWYQNAGKCYAYLNDVPSKATFENSEWFSRGWTLQELLAPSEVYFVDQDWRDLGTKGELRQDISRCTRIPVNILAGADLESASVAQKMSWASHRRTRRVEDRAYCLMGIFGINMPLLYGEGERAFIRLQEEIMRVLDDHSLFAWKSSDNRGGFLATSPDAFVNSQNIVPLKAFGIHSGPVTLSSRGVHLQVRFLGKGAGGLGMVVLHCAERDGNKPVAIYAQDVALTMQRFERICTETFELLDPSQFPASKYSIRQICIQTGRMTPVSRSEESVKHIISNRIYSDDRLSGFMNSDYPAKELFLAARTGLQDDVWLLLTRSDLNTSLKDRNGLTVLWHSVMGNQETLVETLLARSNVEVDSVSNAGLTPLLWAVANALERMVQLLLENGANIEAKDSDGNTSLSTACMKGKFGIAKLLLESGANIEIRNVSGLTPLSIACWHEANDVARLLIQRGANIEAKDPDGNTSLSTACMKGKCGIAKLLLESSANIEITNVSGRTPLSIACWHEQTDIVKLLFERGASVAKDPDRNSLLSIACWKGNNDLAKLLLESGANIDAKGISGRTPLSIACWLGNDDLVKMLLESGANIEGRRPNGRTALLSACSRGHYDMTKLLLEKGADVDAKDTDGWTPLSIASSCGFESIARQLLSHGADVGAKNSMGLGPIQEAQKHGHKALIKLLREKGGITQSRSSLLRRTATDKLNLWRRNRS